MSKIITKLIAIAAIVMSTATCAQSDQETNQSAGDTARYVLITGANRGIGLELARQYSTAGWQVIGTARNPAKADELRNLDVRVMQLDVTDQQSVDALARDLSEQPIDMLINNAGIFPRSDILENVDLDDVNRTLAVNIVGPIRVTRALLPNLRLGSLKKIINVSSNLGSIANNTGGRYYGYRESKAALNMFTRTLAAEFGELGFICIALNPGWVQTDMGGANAMLTVQDSVNQIRTVLSGLKAEDNGTYWSYDGTQLPW